MKNFKMMFLVLAIVLTPGLSAASDLSGTAMVKDAQTLVINGKHLTLWH